MGKLIVTEFMTLDGVAQAPGAPDEDRDGGFDYGGWQAPFVDEVGAGAMFEQARSMDALLLGRHTYDIFAAYWPTAPADIPFTGLLNAVPKYVATRASNASLVWPRSTALTGDASAGVAALKDRHDEVHVIGSLDLVQSLLRARLVDQLQIWMYPLVLGTGKRLFAGGTVPAALRLSESVTYPNGTLQLVYDAAGAPTYGDLAAGADELERLRRQPE